VPRCVATACNICACGRDGPGAAPAGRAGVPFLMHRKLLRSVCASTSTRCTELAKGPAIDPQKVTAWKTRQGTFHDHRQCYQSMFMVYESGVVVVDAPPSFAAELKQAIAEVTKQLSLTLSTATPHRSHWRRRSSRGSTHHRCARGDEAVVAPGRRSGPASSNRGIQQDYRMQLAASA